MGGSEILAKLMGWDGDYFRRQPLIFGYSGAIALSFSKTNCAAGSHTVYSESVVPAGEIWVITSFLYRMDSGSFTRLDAAIKLGGTGVSIQSQTSPTSGQYYDIQGWYVLGPGDDIGAIYYNGTLNDDLYLRCSGFKMEIAE